MVDSQCQSLIVAKNQALLYAVDMDLKERLQFARKRANLKQLEVARTLGVTSQAVSQWERGEADPANEKLRPLAKLYGVTVCWILGGDEPMVDEFTRPAPQILGPRDLKVFAAAEGGPGEMVVSTDPVELVPRPWYMHEVRDGFAVLVIGESMVPAFEPGDMAVVNPRLPPMRGKDVILIGDEQQGEFRASIKRFEGSDARYWHLRQFNPPHGQKPELTWLKKDWPKALRVVGKYYG
jgi:transcriptional regulator with XRE-family HTH domain